MRLLRFVAVALMVTVSVASIGCGPEAKVTPAEEPTTTSSSEGEAGSSDTSGTATAGTTDVSLTVSGMK